MRFPFKPIRAEFVDRPNRFVVVARPDGQAEPVRAHCPDPGRMRELLLPGTTVYLSRSNNPARKTLYDLRFVREPANGELVSINSQLPNRLFSEAIDNRTMEALADCAIVRSEVPSPLASAGPKTARSRFDFLLADGQGDEMWVEVKSATLVENGVAYFPDARTERGRRHVMELTHLRREMGVRASVVFIVQRADAGELRPQRSVDPAFADALYGARNAGVELYAYACAVTLEEVRIERPIAVVVSAPDQ